MHIVRSKFTTKSGKTYKSILLRQSYREGKKTKKRTIANLSSCSKDEIEAIELALKNKKNLFNLKSIESIKTKEGLSVGAVWVLYSVAKELGIVSALGNSMQGKLALWQVIARAIGQGSRLSAVRLAKTHAFSSVIGIEKGFTEDSLYRNLKWLAKKQDDIEKHLFKKRNKKKVDLFLYDVTSSYLEGNKNALSAWGYNRDGKKGKKQIVIGLLCEQDGTPVSTQVFSGNTTDTKTFASQIEKIKNKFNGQAVTIVGDRGMIKRSQIEKLTKHGFHYITSITKQEIQKLINKNTVQYELFDENIVEIQESNIRYILRRNVYRAEEIKNHRINKQNTIEKLISDRNQYLLNHIRANPKVALRKVQEMIKKTNTEAYLSVILKKRKIFLQIDIDELREISKLDGCYVIKTDISKEIIDAKKVHERYKDLYLVESAFRTCKSELEIRPVFVNTAQSTYGHVLVVMLAYMIVRHLSEKWKEQCLTVQECLNSLSKLSMIEISIEGKYFSQIPEPMEQNKLLLQALNIQLPSFLPIKNANVVTRKQRRKSVKSN